MGLELRRATAADAATVLAVIQSAFAIPPDSAKWRSRQDMVEREPHRFQVLTLDGRVIGAVHVADQKLRVGRAVVRKSDVGHVSIDPELQGQGCGSEMMRRLVGWMREAGYDISRLGGRASFYRRFGWVPFPRRFVEFEIGRLDDAAFDAMTAPAAPGAVRASRRARDGKARDALRRDFNAERTGAFNPGAASAPRSISLVYEHEGMVVGCLSGSLTGVDHTPFEAAMQIGDAAFAPGHPEALGELVKQALREARAAGVGRVSARLPFDQRVLDALRYADIGFSTRELESRPGSNMLQILSMASLFGRLVPELEARLAASASAAWRGCLALEAEGRRVELAIEQGSVAVAEGVEPSCELRLGQAGVLRLVLGLNTIDEVAPDATLGPAERSLMRDLFPIQPTASGPWG